VSAEDLEALRHSYQDFNRGDLDAWLEWFHPAITWQAAREDPDAALHRGRDGIRRYAEQWIEAYDALRVEPQELIDRGDQVVVWVRITGVGRTSGIALDMEQAQVMTIRDGEIVGAHEYFDRAEALAAVGLTPSGGSGPRRSSRP
jgi:ketosteroid isomerase-like protein